MKHEDIDHSGLTGVGAADHGALTGLSDDDHPQYVKDSEFGAKGRILVGTGAGTFDDLPAGTDGHVLTLDSGETTGVKWAAATGSGSVATDAIWDAAGDLAVGSGANTAAKLAAGSEGDVLTISSGVPAWEAPTGGAGLTQAYVGYNTIGGSNENSSSRIILKSVTLANDCLMTSIELYVKQVASGSTLGFGAGVWTDSSGPSLLIAGTQAADQTYFLSTSNGAAGAARWLAFPLGVWLAAGTYWIGVNTYNGGSNYNVYYDGSGSDRTYLPTTSRISDAGWTTVTTTSNKYSIRANTIR